MNIGRRLKQQREAAGLDIKEVAHRVGKSYQYVWKIEEGVNEPPTWELLAKLARLYNCSVDSLLAIESEVQINYDEIVRDLLVIIRRLPKYRQRDLIALAEALEARSKKDNTEIENAVLQAIDSVGGIEVERLVLQLLDSLNASGDDNSSSGGLIE